jgi:hypothetical protein
MIEADDMAMSWLSLCVIELYLISQLNQQNHKRRHFGRDAEIRAMEGNVPVLQMFSVDDLPVHSFTSLDIQTPFVTHSLPSMDAGFRHPCRNDGLPTFVYNDERRSMGTIKSGHCL